MFILPPADAESHIRTTDSIEFYVCAIGKFKHLIEKKGMLAKGAVAVILCANVMWFAPTECTHVDRSHSSLFEAPC